MSRTLETFTGTELEVPDETFIRVKIKSAIMLLKVSLELLEKPQTAVEFADGARLCVNEAIHVLYDQHER